MTPFQLTTALSLARQLAHRFVRGDAVWADDLEQEAMLRVWKYADRFEPTKGTWEAFVWQISVSAIRAARRRRQDVRGPLARRYVPMEVVSATLGHPGAGDEAADLFDLMADESLVPADRVAEAKEQLERIVDSLTSEGMRLLLDPVEQIATETGVSHQAVSQQRQKVIEQARKATR